MTDVTDHPTRPSSYADLFVRLDRIEDKLDLRLNSMDHKVDGLASRLDRMEGGLGMVKWLGPTGLAALVIGLARTTGIL